VFGCSVLHFMFALCRVDVSARFDVLCVWICVFALFI
jgi:hypothetical protein